MKEQRARAIRSTVDRIRNIEATLGVTKESLLQIEEQLRLLAENPGWFTEQEFPAPTQKSDDTSYVYRISEDENNNRFALYVQSARAPTNTPPHNHDTWAVITGIRGDELNRFYERKNGGVNMIGSQVVRPGASVTLLPDDLHSIHITDEKPVINFHMYGLGLEYLTEREYYDRAAGEWKIFGRDRNNIIDARYASQ